MNLVIALLSTRSFITADRIRETVYGYSGEASDEAFSRMFERDKNELRDLGIPLETGRVSPSDPTEGYRINRDAYALPAVELTPDEAAAVAVATQLWESPELITATQGALLKLRAAGVDVEAPDGDVAITSTGALPGLRGSEEVLGILLSAIDSGRAVTFPYRPSRSEPYTTRTLEPWGVVTDRGRWYVVGHDRDRDAVRTFRLSRIGPEVRPTGPEGAVHKPEDVDLRGIVAKVVGEWPTAGRPRCGWPTGVPPRCAAAARWSGPGRSGDARGRRSPSTSACSTGSPGRSPATAPTRWRWNRHRCATKSSRGWRRICDAPGGASVTAISARLVRLLNMVPYFQANPKITYTEAASDLGVSVKQLRDDLNQLWMCGLPGYGPGDLIDFEFSGDTIEVTFSAGIDHPLRLTSPEATGVLVALRALVDVPGMVDPEAARSAIAKIESAAGAVGHVEGAAVDEPAPVESEAAAAVRTAVRDDRALAIEYYSASRDMLSGRVVDPIRVVLVADHSYLEAWCRTAEAVRLFRFDRIVDARVLDEPAVPPPRRCGPVRTPRCSTRTPPIRRCRRRRC
ncbi:hypothetical protein MPRF_37700 [Mycolicibacterium parafortuitum]|uniref:Uncharacterized protein n=1 Tax=Mycolicibacterium parafortuitum TaxID=39692 RepID=A0A7I7U7C0_MYCPF|nr:hypothetical protein MPRF_37700 [Mycolicibacterium parafortuitum]